MKKVLMFLLFLSLIPLMGFGQISSGANQPQEQGITFRFQPGDDSLTLPFGSNDVQLSRLFGIIDRNYEAVSSGRMPLYIDGYCTSQKSTDENIKLAERRIEAVITELANVKKLNRKHFKTKAHASGYDNLQDVVVVTVRFVLSAPEPEKEEVVIIEEKEIIVEKQEVIVKEEEVIVKEPEVIIKEREVIVKEPYVPQPSKSVQPTLSSLSLPSLVLRTNLLYDIALAPTLGVEWRVNPAIGIKVDGSYSYWGDEHGKVQKIWMVSPELRYYMGNDKRFYLGVGGNFGEYNVYDYLIGKLFPDNTGYQGSGWNAGLTVGYQLYLSPDFSLDFNLGLGYSYLEYDSFNLIDETRVYKKKDQTKAFWGPSQFGISLQWKIR